MSDQITSRGIRRLCSGAARRATRLLGVAMLVALGAVSPQSARAWTDSGHRPMTMVAFELLPEDVPAFLRAKARWAAHLSVDPDIIKHRAVEGLRRAEEPNHYLDWELLQGRELPEDRYGFMAMCQDLGVSPTKVGMLPYAIIERAEALAIALAEHRLFPDSQVIRMRCVYLAGQLCHYTQDLCMPLHTTIHFNGRVGPDGESPGSGIHLKVDMLPGKTASGDAAVVEAIRQWRQSHAEAGPRAPVAGAQTLMSIILDEFARSHALVDRVYEFEAVIPDTDTQRIDSEALRQFALERGASAAAFTARVIAWSWRKSATIQMPHWYARPIAQQEQAQAQATAASASEGNSN